jgi:hypothetical protein
MDNPAPGQQLQSPGQLADHALEHLAAALHLPEEGPVDDRADVHAHDGDLFEGVEAAAEAVAAQFVDQPGVRLVDLVREQPREVRQPRALLELALCQASELEEVGAEPDLFLVGLVLVLG